jgi:RNA polymerase sigma factor (sigma-70 family)
VFLEIKFRPGMTFVGAFTGWVLLISVSSYFSSEMRVRRPSSKSSVDYCLPTSRSKISMSSVLDAPASSTDKRPHYATAPVSSRWDFGRKLTIQNKQYSDMGLKLRKSYTKLRQLTREEEMTAGKFSNVGRRMDNIHKILNDRLGRDPTDEEWAAACKINVGELDAYQKVAKSARNRLVQHNMRIVDFWVRRIIEHSKAAKDISYYELVTEGVKGLSEASEKYDGRGPFIRYAQHFVRAELYKGLTVLKPGSFAISQNTKAAMVYLRTRKAYKILVEEFGREPSDVEIAAYLTSTGLNVSADTLQWARDVVNVKVISAETQFASSPGDSGENLNTYMDLYLKADQTNFSTEALMWKVDFNAALDCLNPQERRTIAIRYGLMDGKPRTVERTAALMCMSSEAVRLIVIAALEKLRQSPHADFLLEGPPQAPVTTTNGKMGAIAY